MGAYIAGVLTGVLLCWAWSLLDDDDASPCPDDEDAQ